jgi:signal transduction protein with GAF and PtsI domain
MKNRDHSKLESLARVIREVDSAPDMETALSIVVKRTREIMAADVCTVYFTEHERQRHVIVATDGLSPTVVGHVQFGFGNGLIGKVAESTKPVNLDHVPAKLDEGFVQQSSAGRFHGFLGVPITHRSKVQGVLVVRQRAAREFDEADASFLITLSAQLGGAIVYAKSSGDLCSLCRPDAAKLDWIEGLPGAPGIAVGTGVVVFPPTDLCAVPYRKPEDPQAEEQCLRNAVAQTQEEVRRLNEDLDGTLSAADRALFNAYALILNSPEIVEATVVRIHKGNWAPGALRQTIELSHSAILARAYGIPAVMGVRNIPLEPLDNLEIIADGTQGRIYLRPNPLLRKEIERLICKEQDLEENLKSLRDLPSKTKNGVDSSLPPIGLMIEMPSAVYQLEELARRADFFSVGSNDLAQYLLAIDRDNPHVAQRLDPLRPAVLRALRQVVDASRRSGKPVAVCGEMASDPGCALLLLGLGFNSLSISAAALPRVKWAIRSVDFSRMQSLAKKALMLDRPEPIRQLLEKALEGAGLDQLLRRPTTSIADDTTLEPGAVRTTRPFQSVNIS